MARPWMPLYIADYLRDTRKLTPAEHGAYLLLIMEYWTSGGLPDDDKQLSRIVGMSSGEWRKASPNIKSFFGNDWKSHKRIDAELAKSADISSKRAASAKQKHSNSSSNAEQMDTHAGATSQPQLQKEDRIVDAGASHFTEGSKKLTDTFLKALGFESPLDIPPELAGADWRAIGWETAGWTADLIDAETRKIARDKPLKPLNYFEKCFATSFAKRQAPLPVVEIREAEQLTVTTHGKPQNGIIRAADDLRRKVASFDGPPSRDLGVRDGQGAPAPRLLSNR